MKNRNIYTGLILVLTVVLFSFTSISKKEITVTEGQVTWKGYKVTGHHEGTLSLKTGTLIFEDDKLVGGNFSIDMTTLVVTDLPVERRGRLEGHLKSDDFFSVENHPTSTLNITSVANKITGESSYGIVADLTIKGITNSIEFKMSVSENSAKADLVIDRTKYDIKFRSASFFEGLKDKAISDEFELSVALKY